MTTNKQALLPTKEEARESGNILIIVAARLVCMECFTPLHFLSERPGRVVSMRALREALDRSQDNLRNEVSKIVDGHNRMADRLKEAEAKLEAAERRTKELESQRALAFMASNRWADKFREAEKRIAELEDPDWTGEVSDEELNAALQVHRLKVDGHSQLSDAFRSGFKYARRAAAGKGEAS